MFSNDEDSIDFILSISKSKEDIITKEKERCFKMAGIGKAW